MVLRGLQTELAVRRLTAALALFAAAVSFKFKRGRGAELIDVAAGEAGAVGPVPVLFKEH